MIESLQVSQEGDLETHNFSQGSWLSSTKGLARCSEKYGISTNKGWAMESGTGTMEMRESLVVQQ